MVERAFRGTRPHDGEPDPNELREGNLDTRATEGNASTLASGELMVGLEQAGILLVEDHPTLRDTLLLALGRAGYQVHGAASAREAMEWWRGHADEVDLLLVDCGLGHASGRSLACELRHDRPGLRVLYVSGAPEHLPERDAIGPHEGCLLKPFGSQALLTAIEGLLK